MARVEVSLQRDIDLAHIQYSIKEGRRTFTLLTAAAFGDYDEGGSKMSAERKADAIGVRKQNFNFAVDRAERLRADLHPTEARKGSVYWFWSRAQRSDATSDELMLLIRQYCDTDEVSRATGNSADRDMWKGVQVFYR